MNDVQTTVCREPFRSLDRCKLGIVGLGYTGLSLAVEFGKHFDTVGFDIEVSRIAELRDGSDRTREVEPTELRAAVNLSYTTNIQDLEARDAYIISVPTPVDHRNRPDLSCIESASELVGQVLRRGAVVVYESTVYPGCIENFAVPILERASGLKFNRDFFTGYSPERINPGDRHHRLADVKKIISGSTPAAADFVDSLYAKVVTAGTHKVSSIRAAEAVKLIENCQRDVNIALVNEFALILDGLGLDTAEILQAAGTKWNFLPFRPGLVGGRCIGVSAWYLLHCAQTSSYSAKLISTAREINDGMVIHIVERVVRLMERKVLQVAGSRCLVMGLAYKEDCGDVRGTRIVDLLSELRRRGVQADVYDPLVDPQQAERECGFRPLERPQPGSYDAIVLAVAHRQFRELGMQSIRGFGKRQHVLFDVKHVLNAGEADEGL